MSPAPQSCELETESHPRTPEHWMLLVMSVLGVAGLFVVAVFLEPDPRGYGTHEQLGLTPCYPMERWAFPCPGCGVTTSVALLTHGAVLASLVTQPLGALLAVGLLAFFGWALRGQLRGRDLWVELNGWNLALWGKLGFLAFGLSWLYKILAVRFGG